VLLIASIEESNVTGWPRVYLGKVQRCEKKISLEKEKEKEQERAPMKGL
jgi:hypothetical protein